jgi:hypothetical protein
MAKSGGGAGRGGGNRNANIINAINSGNALNKNQLEIIKSAYGGWVNTGTRGSQSTPREYKLNKWEKGGKIRMYVNERIGIRLSTLGHIDMITGKSYAQGYYEAGKNTADLSNAVSAILSYRK